MSDGIQQTVIAEIRLRLPPDLVSLVGEKINEYMRTLLGAGSPGVRNPTRADAWRLRIVGRVARSARFDGRRLSLSYRMVDHLECMREVGACPCCGADLPAAFSLTSSPGWGRCAECPGPCDPTWTRCCKIARHADACAMHPSAFDPDTLTYDFGG